MGNPAALMFMVSTIPQASSWAITWTQTKPRLTNQYNYKLSLTQSVNYKPVTLKGIPGGQTEMHLFFLPLPFWRWAVCSRGWVWCSACSAAWCCAKSSSGFQESSAYSQKDKQMIIINTDAGQTKMSICILYLDQYLSPLKFLFDKLVQSRI